MIGVITGAIIMTLVLVALILIAIWVSDLDIVSKFLLSLLPILLILFTVELGKQFQKNSSYNSKEYKWELDRIEISKGDTLEYYKVVKLKE